MTKVHFTCAIGTTLQGASSGYCMPSGQWSDPLPRCIVTECPDLSKHPKLQSITIGQNGLNNTTYLSASSSSFSSSSKELLISNNIKIVPAEIQQNHERRIGDKAVFTCPRGYGLQGSHHELYCLESGQWSGQVPYCQEVQCTSPQAPENGFIEGLPLSQGGSQSQTVVEPNSEMYYAGDIVQFACVEGFMLDGNPISICQENGRWSGPRARCVPACTYPGLAHSARLLSEVRFFYPINATIAFECVEGFEMRGNGVIKCIYSGRWSGSIPECVSVKK